MKQKSSMKEKYRTKMQCRCKLQPPYYSIVAIRRPKRQVCKDSHYGSKQQ